VRARVVPLAAVHLPRAERAAAGEPHRAKARAGGRDRTRILDPARDEAAVRQQRRLPDDESGGKYGNRRGTRCTAGAGWVEDERAGRAGAVAPRSADRREIQRDVDMEWRTARRGHDREPDADRAIGIEESRACDRRTPSSATLIIEAIERVNTTVQRHGQCDDVAVRLQLPAERAQRLRCCGSRVEREHQQRPADDASNAHGDHRCS
jgi:hypothetical protein